MPEARIFTVSEDDDGIRLDRWFKRHAPDVSFNVVSRWSRTGQLRLNGRKAVPGDRIEAGQEIRFPSPETSTRATARREPRRDPLSEDETRFVRDMVIYEDPNAFVLNKPPGLATQGGTKTTQHLDRLLDGIGDERGHSRGEQGPADIGKLRGLARSVEQGEVQRLLERLNALADRRLDPAELAGCRGEAAGLDHGDQDPHLVQGHGIKHLSSP